MNWEDEVKAVVWDKCIYCSRGGEDVPDTHKFVALIDGTYKPTCVDCGFEAFDGERMGVSLARKRIWRMQ